MVQDVQVDVLVAGGGVGGLMAAYRAQRAGARVLLLNGSRGASSRISSLNSALGYAPADTPAGVFDDMLRAGGNINDPGVVAALAARIGPETVHLADIGVPFLRDGERLARRQAAGSTWTRAVYSLGMIGVDISRRLLAEIEACDAPPALQVKGGLMFELYTGDGRVTGALAHSPRDGRWMRIGAPAVVLATGGGGQLFETTTNPPGSKGMGYAVALEAGAELTDMEFVSFEPFVTSAPADARRQDLPTTVLREGARLRNGLGDEFLDTASAPTKDIICRAMVREVLEGRGTPSGSVYYDIREMDPELVERYVQIRAALRSRGITPGEAQLEVMPAQHYLMGGVKIDRTCASTLPGLYAVGEVAGGAHGAHRLAAAGGLEVVAGGAIAGEDAARYALAHPGQPLTGPVVPRPEFTGVPLSPTAKEQLGRIRSALDKGCGILRNGPDLASSVEVIRGVLDETRADTESAFIWRSALVALSIAQLALLRKESRGDHYRTDHPQRDDLNWLGNLVLSVDGDSDLSIRFEGAGIAHRERVDVLEPDPA